MSTVETETNEATETTEDPILKPVTDLEDLFADDPDELEEPEIPENLSEDELRARLTQAEKRATFERNERLKTARKSWIQEAAEHFPYSKPESIKAESRRSFMEEAKAQDADFRERAAPILAKTEKTEEQLRAEIRAEVEAEAARAWGRPTTQSGGSGGEATEAAEVDKRLESARRGRDLLGATKALMDGRRI